MTARSARLLAALAALAAAAGCGAAPPRPAAATNAVIRIDCAQADATVYVDDVWVGEVADLSPGMSLRPGPHRIEVRSDHHHTRYLELTVAAGERSTLRVVLAEALE